MTYQETLLQIKAENKEKALASAIHLFVKKGIEPVKMTDIAEDAKIGVASLYRYFKVKDTLIIECGNKIWNDVLNKLIPSIIESNQKLTGFEQIKNLLNLYLVLYQDYKDYIRFLNEFDSYFLTHHLEKDSLKVYESKLEDIYSYFEKAYSQGINDNTLKPLDNLKEYYNTLNHALMALLQKMLRGDITSSDHFETSNELNIMIDIILNFIKKELTIK